MGKQSASDFQTGGFEPFRLLERPYGVEMKSDAIRDELLVLRCQEGDSRAFAGLVNRWQGRLVGHARRLTQNSDAALDVVQETWMAIIKGLGRLDNASSFPAWAFRILTRKCSDWIRKEKRRRRLEGELAQNNGRQWAHEPVDAADQDLLEQALAALTREHRSAVALFYLEDFTLEEIARIEAVPVGTVKSRLHHARRRLREIVEGKENG